MLLVIVFMCTSNHIYVHCSAKKAELLVKALRQTLSDFSRDRSLRRLSYNEEQIHKFDR